MTPPLVVLGDVLLDLDLIGAVTRQCPDAPAAPVLDVGTQRCRAGGAGLAAVLAAADGVPVRLVTALAEDAAADLLRGLLDRHVELVAGRAVGGTAVKCRLRAGDRSLARVDLGSGAASPAGSGMADALDGAGAVLVSDYGRGITADPLLRHRLARLAGQVPVVWDPHPRGGAPVRGCALVSPNLDEALRCAGTPDRAPEPGRSPEAGRSPRRTPSPDRSAGKIARVLAAGRAAGRLRARWGALGVVVTLGADGALLHGGARPDSAARSRLVPAHRVVVGDPCGAGDRFAASVALALRAGRPPLAAVRAGVRDATRFVEGGAAIPDHPASVAEYRGTEYRGAGYRGAGYRGERRRA